MVKITKAQIQDIIMDPSWPAKKSFLEIARQKKLSRMSNVNITPLDSVSRLKKHTHASDGNKSTNFISKSFEQTLKLCWESKEGGSIKETLETALKLMPKQFFKSANNMLALTKKV